MTTFTTEDRINAAPACGCGRSPTGRCCGWHSLTEDQYQVQKTEYELNEYRKQAESLWFAGGSCTGGKAE